LTKAVIAAALCNLPFGVLIAKLSIAAFIAYSVFIALWGPMYFGILITHWCAPAALLLHYYTPALGWVKLTTWHLPFATSKLGHRATPSYTAIVTKSESYTHQHFLHYGACLVSGMNYLFL
jgi:hypothetical protein